MCLGITENGTNDGQSAAGNDEMIGGNIRVSDYT